MNTARDYHKTIENIAVFQKRISRIAKLRVIIIALVKRCIPPRFLPKTICDTIIDKLRMNSRISAGPFTGLVYPKTAVGSIQVGKLIGVYEKELIPFVLDVIKNPPSTIINVGAGEGYYSLGFATRCPNSRVISFEASDKGRDLLAEFARVNGVASRIEIYGQCETVDLISALAAAPPFLLIMDCEGYEEILLDPAVCTELQEANILVEIHDFQVRDKTCRDMGELIWRRFAKTHIVNEIWTRPFEPSDFDFLKSCFLRHYLFAQLNSAADEMRDVPMRWFQMTPKK